MDEPRMAEAGPDTLLAPTRATHGHTVSSQNGTGEPEPIRGVFALRMPRKVMARVTGTLDLRNLPRHRPEVVSYPGRQFRDDEVDD